MIISKKTKFNSILSILILLSFLSFNKFNFLLNSIESAESDSNDHLTLNHNFIKLIHLGNPKIFSSYLWMLSLLQSDLIHVEHSKRSWLYYRIKTIAELDPYFRENYINGGLYLSIVNDDLPGADDIFSHGLRFFPEDSYLLWYKGFNLCFEMGECPKALDSFIRLDKIRKPDQYVLTPRIISKIQAQEGLLELSFQTLLHLYKNTTDESVKGQIYKSLYSIKATIDLKCLNSNESAICTKVDLSGNQYLKNEEGIFYSKDPILEKALRVQKKGE